MIEAIEMIVTKINSLGLYAKCKIGTMEQTNEAISLIISPSGYSKYYMDGDRIEPFSFQIQAKSTNQMQVIMALDKIKDTLESMDIQTTTQPNLVEQNGMVYIYASIFTTTIGKFK